MSDHKYGNPAVVGLAGFGTTTLLLQLHNLGFAGTGVVFCCAMMFGGLAQLIAGFLEFKVGNNFGFSAFVSYGAFWLGLGSIWLIADLQHATDSWIGAHLSVSGPDIGIFLVGYTVYTVIMFFGALRVHKAMAFTFLTLLIGFIGLDIIFLTGDKTLLTATAIDLILCAGGALYMMAGIIYNDLAGRTILPMGDKILK